MLVEHLLEHPTRHALLDLLAVPDTLEGGNHGRAGPRSPVLRRGCPVAGIREERRGAPLPEVPFRADRPGPELAHIGARVPSQGVDSRSSVSARVCHSYIGEPLVVGVAVLVHVGAAHEVWHPHPRLAFRGGEHVHRRLGGAATHRVVEGADDAVQAVAIDPPKHLVRGRIDRFADDGDLGMDPLVQVRLAVRHEVVGQEPARCSPCCAPR